MKLPLGPMRILIVHNRYQQAGGEDSVFANEVALLRSGRHDVETLLVSNDSLDGFATRAAAALFAAYNPSGRRLVASAIAAFRPDVVHVHNFFPQISPSMFDACGAAGVPAVWTMHNFRIACANGLLFRDGAPCELCVGGSALSGILHRCYRGSLAGSAAVAASIGYHRLAGSWNHKVARYIALTEFSRTKLIRAGLPPKLIVVKPNFVADPMAHGHTTQDKRRGALFVGRLSPEKGVTTLLEAWKDLDIPLEIIGDGPQRTLLEKMAPPNVRFLGFQSAELVSAAMAAAAAIIVPSIWYENFPMTVVEAMAVGTPVIASRRGALAEIVHDGIDGALFAPGDASALAACVAQLFADPRRLAAMGRAARDHFQRALTPEVNLLRLEAIYADAIAHRVGLASGFS